MRGFSGCETGGVQVCIGTVSSQGVLRFEPKTLAKSGVLSTILRVACHRRTLNSVALLGASSAIQRLKFVNGPRAQDLEASFDWHLAGEECKRITISNGALIHRAGSHGAAAQAVLRTSRVQLAQLLH
jgi:Alkyl sulfatase C-terminal